MLGETFQKHFVVKQPLEIPHSPTAKNWTPEKNLKASRVGERGEGVLSLNEQNYIIYIFLCQYNLRSKPQGNQRARSLFSHNKGPFKQWRGPLKLLAVNQQGLGKQQSPSLQEFEVVKAYPEGPQLLASSSVLVLSVDPAAREGGLGPLPWAVIGIWLLWDSHVLSSHNPLILNSIQQIYCPSATIISPASLKTNSIARGRASLWLLLVSIHHE